jgi:NLI interacting factor-like phosphatase
MNIILDMDQTLIDGIFGLDVTPRPHLNTFLKWCFENFTNVSIWTAASNEWYDYVYINVFKDILESLNTSFHFVFTSNRCTNVWTYSEWDGCSKRTIEKRVRKLHRYKSEKYRDYTIDNIIIVDDVKSTFTSNYGNGIQISPFINYGGIGKNDNDLLKLIIYLRDVVIPHYEKNGTILDLDKRYWEDYVQQKISDLQCDLYISDLQCDDPDINDLLQEEPDKISMFPNQQSNISKP